VPFRICFLIIPVKIPKSPLTLMFQSTLILVILFSIALIVIVFFPFIGPSIIFTLTEVLACSSTISLHTEFLKAISTSLSMVLPYLLIFLIDLVPCQNSGSLSISTITFHTLSSDAGMSLLA
jgi:hypothetical protein